MLNIDDVVIGALRSQLRSDVWENFVPIVKVDEHTYAVYVLDDIGPPDLYSELVHLLTTADENTTINVFLNTPGGHLDTAEMLYSALVNSKANTCAKVSGTVASAGTVITLACKNQEFSPSAIFMIHESSFSGLGGKASDMLRFQEFHKRWLPEFYTRVYGKLLSEAEMKEALAGKEFWFTGKEITERVGNVRDQ